MARIISRLGTIPKSYRYSAPKEIGRAHMSLHTYVVDGVPYPPNVVVRKPCACVLPIDQKNKEVWLIQQPRFNRALTDRPLADMPFEIPAEDVLMYEAPAGAQEPGETMVGASVRELYEETGLITMEYQHQLVQKAAAPAMGGCTEQHSYFFAAIDPTYWDEPPGDGTETGIIWALSFDEAFTMLEQGQIICGNTSNLIRELRIRVLMGSPIFQ